MSGSLRAAFSLAIAIVISVASLPSPAAGADARFRTEEPVSLEGRGIGPDSFVVGGIDVGCDDALLHGTLAGSSKTLEIEPEFESCRARALSGFPADFFQENCPFLLHGLRPAGQSDRWRADVDLKCYGEWVGVGWDFFETEGRYKEVVSVCSFRILAQPEIGVAELRSLGQDRGIEVRWDLDRFEYAMSEDVDEPTSSLLCGSSLGHARGDAHYRGTAIVAAEGPGGRPAELSIGP